MPGRVVLTDNIFDSLQEVRAVLDTLELDLDLAPSSDEETLIEQVQGASGMMVVYARITERVIAASAAAGCRIISRCGIGYDNIDIAAATRHGVQVTCVPDYCLDEVADHTMALLLAFARGIVPAVIATRAGRWSAPKEGIHRLQGRRLALLGVGRIGRRVVTRAQAFELQVNAYDPFLKDWDLPGVVRAASLEELLAEADYVSLHAPMTAENRGLIGDRTLVMMKRAPVIVNTSRGGLVDLEAAMCALDDGRLSGLALDVTEIEPLPSDHPLRDHPKVLITPHMAFRSEEAEAELKRRSAEEIVRAIGGEPPRCPVNQVIQASPDVVRT